MFMFSRPSSFSVAGVGPKPMIRGATPAVAAPRMRATGVRPCFSAASGEAMTSAQAPSLTPEALPAVTEPPSRKGVFNAASLSIVVWRGCSSVSTTTGSPLRCGMVTGVISFAIRPDAMAAAARSCERKAKASWPARETLKSSATFSAVSGMESMPKPFCIALLTNLQPMVVS